MIFNLALICGILLLSLSTANGGIVAGPGRLVEWVPYSEGEPDDPSTYVSAAFNPRGSPVVLYDPDQLAKVHPNVRDFLLLRQEIVALLARDIYRRTGRLPKGSEPAHGWARPVALIPESFASTHPALQGLRGPEALDCAAYQSLDSNKRFEMRRQLEQAPVQIWPGSRTLTARDLSSLESIDCRAVAQRVLRAAGA